MSGRGDDRELESRAAELKARVAELEKEAGVAGKAPRDRGKIAGAWHRLLRYLGPIGRFIDWLLGLVARWLRWVLFSTDKSSGERRLSWRRAAITLPISLVALVGVHATLKAIYFYSTYFEETVYVTGKQEIETGELYQFGGCTSLPCSTETDNGKFYLVESSLYFPVMFYPEEDVFANIPQQNGACNVEGYGIYFRTLRWLYKSAQLYQHVVDVSCRPYTQEEIRLAVEGGQIIEGPATREIPPP